MNRRELLKGTSALGLLGAIPFLPSAGTAFANASTSDQTAPSASPLKAPASGSIPVAVVLSEGAVVIDFCGPWEVFESAYVPRHEDAPFELYTVAADVNPIHASGGLKIVPDYSFKNAPAPKVIVIPAQHESSPAMLEWIRASAKTADVTMSVCTGSFILAETGLLAGKSATTHHSAYKTFAVQFSDVHCVRGVRFVEDGNLATAGGLSSGIDLALRVVERYYGRDIAKWTAFQMEYQGEGWVNPGVNAEYAKVPVSTPEHPLCPVCNMEVVPDPKLSSVYQGKTYYFCMADHKAMFDAKPKVFLEDGA
ncbi:MAG: DJ-1/PfpI family protein [Candidatus Acidiferrales bacterium]|jgi:putative intracellular protease/amidase/YHS domain-containing protein